MKIFDQNYIGVNHERKDITLAPLAFLTPYEDNAAGRKRQDSVITWLSGRYYNCKPEDVSGQDIRIIANVAKTGFRVVDVAERYMTSNKFARIFDPDGFELEISIENLVDLMLYTIVDHGEIQGELIWGRDGAHNRLIPVDSELYRGALREGQIIRPTVGDIVKGNYNRRFIYLGNGYAQPVALCGTEVANNHNPDINRWRPTSKQYVIEPTFVGTLTSTGARDHIYLYLPDNSNEHEFITSRKKPMKLLGNMGKSDRIFDPDTVYRSDSGLHYSADGEFRQGYEISGGREDKHRHYSRVCMVREIPFTSTDIDFAVAAPQIQKLN